MNRGSSRAGFGRSQGRRVDWLPCGVLLLAIGSGGSAGAAVPALFDLLAIRDASTADCLWDRQPELTVGGVPLDAWRLSYRSWEAIDGRLQPIRIRAFAARPRSGSDRRQPAVVQAHGLGGAAAADSANELAARLGMFALTFSGPGCGTAPDNTSEGRPSSFASGYRMFDTQKDVRGSWFWAHTVAALRALTCLAGRSDVDGDRLGMTGFSAGAVASLLAAGVDDRLRAVVPLSGALAWGEATRSTAAWEHELLAQSHLDLTSAEWSRLNAELLDPPRSHPGEATKVFLINGSSDEFFPLTAHVKTLQALAGQGGGGELRSSLIGNYDHGCYKTLGVEQARQINDRLNLRASGGQRAWFRHYLAADPAYPAIPQPPQVTAIPRGQLTLFRVQVDQPALLDIKEVRLWWSSDRSFTYDSLLLLPQSPTHYAQLTPILLDAATIYFVDVEYQTREQPTPQRFSISSQPVIPSGLVPHIRSYGACR